MDFDGIPNQWFCPITQELMTDPVIGSDGYTYEKKAIKEWLEKSKMSPVTRQPMQHHNLIPNLALKHTINSYLERANVQGPIKINSEKAAQLKKQAVKKVKHFQQEEMTLNIDSKMDGQDCLVNLEIIPPSEKSQAKRRPCSLICILDVSESMGTDAVLGGKDVESHGFSRLDLVKHSINTMIEFMNDCDEIAIIPFSNSARVLMNPTKMTVAGKNLAKLRVKQLEAKGSTNIWDGLKVSLEVAKTINFQNKNIFTVLLTDGEPNLNPPRGIVPTLKKFIDIEKLTSPNIHVFGYGYELDTKLLSEIAQTGNGTYAYIPDCSMVGTVFVNFMANSLSTITNMAELTFQIPRQANLTEIVGYKLDKSNKINVGCIQYGQTRNILLKFKNKFEDPESSVGKISLRYGVSLVNETSIELKELRQTKDKAKMEELQIRYNYLSMLLSCLANGKKLEHSLQNVRQFYYSMLKINKENPTEFVQALLKELKNDASENQGQVQKAYLNEQWYNKWGKHYIPSLFLAHLMQTCTNFKDPGLQFYGGTYFNEFQNSMDTIFIKMPPPQPSAKKQKNIVYKPAPVDMSDYYNYGGGCIDGNCTVSMADGSSKPIRFLVKGDSVKTSDDKLAKVICMVRTNVFGFVDMVKIGPLVITEWHPVRLNGQWKFPASVGKKQRIYVESYYNYVLEGGKSLFAEGVQCIGLGHEINDNEVTKHQYFGTRAVIDQLKRAPQWASGIVEVVEQTRDPSTSQVIRMKFKELK